MLIKIKVEKIQWKASVCCSSLSSQDRITEKIFLEIMAKTFPNLMNILNIQTKKKLS